VRRRAIAAGLGLLVSLAWPSAADSAPDPCHVNPNLQACVLGNGTGTLTGIAQESVPSASSSNGPSAGQPVALPGTYVVYQYAPTCTGNTRVDGTGLCGGAVVPCQPPGSGLISYWRWEVTVDRATQAVRSVVQSPGTFCLGPAVAGLPATAVIAGLLAADFQKLVVVKGKAIVKPKGTTLVNYDTGFYTDARRYVLAPVHILGHTVVVTATPKQYDWYFGDGTSALDAGPGQRDSSDVRHRYADRGSVAPYVVITWTGTFTVDDGQQRDVFGTARTTGDGTPLEVKQARAELVSG
jgi:hypothetical protein